MTDAESPVISQEAVGMREDKLEMDARDELLGEALYGLSARLLLSGFLDNPDNHAAYEKVVEAFNRPLITFD